MTKQCSTAFKLKKHAQYFCLLTGVLSSADTDSDLVYLRWKCNYITYCLARESFFSEISHNYGTLGGRNREPLQSGIEVSEWWKVILAVNSFQIHQGVPHHPSSTFQVSTETMSRYDSITGILACLQLATRKHEIQGALVMISLFQKYENPICCSTETHKYIKKLKNGHFSATRLFLSELITHRGLWKRCFRKAKKTVFCCPRNITVALTGCLQALLCSPQRSFALVLT